MTSFVSKTDSYRPHLTPTPERLRGKVALITGGVRGIGRAIAQRYAEEGAGIAVVDQDVGPPESHAVSYQADVANRQQVEGVVNQVLQRIGHIDILLNNAGMIVFGSLLDCRQEDWDRMLAVDLTGAFHFTQVVGRAMLERNRGGRMIHVGSTASLYPAPQQAAYSVAKAGLRMLSRQAALEFADRGITWNLLCPMGAVTDINRDLLSAPSVMQALEASIPAGRMATVEEIAALAAFLASDEAAYITGAELVHDGGVSISGLWWR
jgi:NAD(P)-dependent dehydrogenase (short-subunit alcohol dehydrogenase family)